MQQNPTQTPAERQDNAERDVLYLLTEPNDGQPLWSVPDIGREIESDEPIVLVRGLHRAGLVNKTLDGYIFATRAGVRVVQMIGHVI
jgi:Mn-dependent DtxR family transcriptional regulator